MKNSLLIIFICSILIALSSCGRTEDGNKRSLPSVTGKASELVVVIDKNQWNSIGNEFEKTFRKEFPFLPQPEPAFDLVHIPYSAFSNIFKTHRNLVMTKFLKESKPKILVKKDVYSYPQLVVTIIAPDTASMKKLIIKERNRLMAIFTQKEKSRIIKNYTKYKDRGIRKAVKKRFNIDLMIPKGYSIDVDSSNFIWLAHETSEISQAVLVYSYDYKDTSDFSLDSLISKRNQFCKKYVPASREGSYMTTEHTVLPLKRAFMKNDLYVAEVRGLWRAHKDFMGGPFINYSIIDNENSKIVCIEGFVFAPNKKKRNYMRQLEAILSTVKIAEKEPKKK